MANIAADRRTKRIRENLRFAPDCLTAHPRGDGDSAAAEKRAWGQFLAVTEDPPSSSKGRLEWTRRTERSGQERSGSDNGC